MKKLLILITILLVGCAEESEPSFQEQIDEYVLQQELNELNRVVLDDTLVLFDTVEEVGMIRFTEDGFDSVTEFLLKEGSDVELLHIGDEVDTFFGVVVRNESLYNEGDIIKITLVGGFEVITFDITGSYEMIMAQYLDKSLTSCSAELIQVFSGTELLYEESLIPVWGE